jgi:two-component system response regulator (stage 0 sporulation protein F)
LTDLERMIEYEKIRCGVSNLRRKTKKILIVDDEENARIGLSKLLGQEGYEVGSVANGHEALEFLRHNPVHLVISDINMPEMNGLVFLRELNRNYPSTAVIMITAYGGVESYLEAMNLGAFEYINKPVKLDELKLVMNKIFSHRHAARVVQKHPL